MDESEGFDLQTFIPYLLNRAAEASSLEFERYYRDTYGMLRTEWRVLFHLWRYGELTATEICQRATIHKTKVSRAVNALEKKRFLGRERLEEDRRHETLILTNLGRTTCEDLTRAAEKFNLTILEGFSKSEEETLRSCLIRIAQGVPVR